MYRYVVFPLTALLALAAPAAAQPGDSHTPRATVERGKLQVDGQYYAFDVDGMRSYVNGLKFHDPEAYELLDRKLRPIEAKQRRAKTVLYTSLSVGLIGLVAGGVMVFSHDDDEGVDGPPAVGTALFVGGILTPLVGGGIAELMAPDEDDLLDVVNEHNRIAKQRIELTAAPLRGGAMAGVKLTF